MKLLVTGFEPFNGYSINPSAEIARDLSGRSIGSFEVVGAVLPLDYNRAFQDLLKLIEDHTPEVVLLCGQANRAAISLERLAINCQNTGRSDNQGHTPEQDVIEPSGEVAYFANIDPHPLVEALTEDGIQAYVSYHAGTYGCNWLFYKMMKSISQGKHDVRAIFIHLPPFPEQALEKSKLDMATMPRSVMTRGLEIVIQNLPQ